MRTLPLRRLALVLVLAAGVSSAADAQDTPEPPPAPAPGDGSQPAPEPGEGAPPAPAAEEPPATPAADAPPPGPTDAEDAAARAVLTAAAERQGGATLGPPDGRLESFHVVFQRVILHQRQRQADGTLGPAQRMDTEEPGLVLDWKGGQIRTEWRISGKTPVTRGLWHRPLPDGSGTKDWPWLWDGATAKNLLGSGDAKDREELDRDRSVVQSLLDVAVLRNLLHDGSRWKRIDDAAFPGVALLRTPPAGKQDALRLTLWIDPETRDVLAARIPSDGPGDPTLWYALEYHEKFPAVTGATIRFPFHVVVKEQLEPGGALEPKMEAFAREASFNDVPDARFVMPGVPVPAAPVAKPPEAPTDDGGR